MLLLFSDTKFLFKLVTLLYRKLIKDVSAALIIIENLYSIYFVKLTIKHYLLLYYIILFIIIYILLIIIYKIIIDINFYKNYISLYNFHLSKSHLSLKYIFHTWEKLWNLIPSIKI